MPRSKASLVDLVNPVREYVCSDGRTIRYRALTLRHLAELESQYGTLDALLQDIAAGKVTAILALIDRAVRAAGEDIDVADLFPAGSIREGGDAYNLLMAVLSASGFEVGAQGKDESPSQTG